MLMLKWLFLAQTALALAQTASVLRLFLYPFQVYRRLSSDFPLSNFENVTST